MRRQRVQGMSAATLACAAIVAQSVWVGPAAGRLPSTGPSTHLAAEAPNLAPPFAGTVWIDAFVLTPTSETDFLSAMYRGVERRQTFDRRVDSWVTRSMHIVEARFECGKPMIEVLVNTEFEPKAALAQAKKYSQMAGQLPPGLRRNVNELWIHGGQYPAGGGNNSILIHTDELERHAHFAEEVLLHEAAHTSLDYEWNGTVDETEWRAVAALDGQYIPKYAQQYPVREDIAESYGAFAVWERAARTGERRNTAARIEATIPNRLQHFKELGDEYSLSGDTCPNYGELVPPSRVRKLTVTYKARWARVSWRPPTHWGGGSIQVYEYRVGNRDWIETTTPTARVPRRSKKTVQFEVRAKNGDHPGPSSKTTIKRKP